MNVSTIVANISCLYKFVNRNLAKSLNLANVVADEELKFYEHFQASKKMTLFLKLIRDSSLALIEDSGKAFA